MLIKLLLVSLSLAVYLVSGDDVDITKGPPDYDKPWVDGWGFNQSDHLGWKKQHEHMLKQTADHGSKIKVIFFGDSKIARLLSEGKAIWDEYFAPKHYYNYGIRGDSTRQILWRMHHKEFEGLTPKVLVFMIGGNNFKSNYNRGTDDEILKAMDVIVKGLREMLPKTELVLVGQLPRKGTTDKRARYINSAQVDEYKESSDKMVHFVNLFANYTTTKDKQNTKLFIEDGIHLNEDGYKILAQTLDPIIKKLINRNEKIVLNKVTGFAEFGSLTAVMGPSGAGLTSLLRCLNGMNNRRLDADSRIRLSRDHKIRSAFIGHNEKEILIMGLTAKQNMIYASKLKNSGLPEGKTIDHNMNVSAIMTDLLMSDIMNTRVDRCSGGEQKRLAIAVELTAFHKPNLILFDEPTTGLDSNVAEVGGQCVYFGPPVHLRHHLSSSNIVCNENQVPIEHLLTIASKGSDSTDVIELRAKTGQRMNQFIYHRINDTINKQIHHKSKPFLVRDVFLLTKRWITEFYSYKWRIYLLNLAVFVLSAAIFALMYGSDIGQYDDCMAGIGVQTNETCLEILDRDYQINQNLCFLTFTSWASKTSIDIKHSSRRSKDNRRLSIAWIDLTLKVDKTLYSSEKVILRGVNGLFEFNSLNALMGPSGAGKTLLLRSLNGMCRHLMTEESKIYLSTFHTIRTCFIAQDQREHLITGLTVKQSLIYASKLKNSSKSYINHEINVFQLMQELSITDIMGVNVEKCSSGQQKRIVMAMELTPDIKPNLICIDEPTSGVDSYSALLMIKCFKKLSQKHRLTIITSIHQPNLEILMLFDSLYVLAKGGLTVYSGPPKHLSLHLQQCNIAYSSEQIPIEVLMKIAANGSVAYTFSYGWKQLLAEIGCVALAVNGSYGCRQTAQDLDDLKLTYYNNQFISFIVTTQFFFNLILSAMKTSSQIKLFMSEHRNFWYSTESFFVVKSVMDFIPFMIILASVVAVIDNYDKEYTYWSLILALSLSCLQYQSLGQICGICFEENGVLVGILLIPIAVVFSDSVILLHDLGSIAQHLSHITSSAPFIRYTRIWFYGSDRGAHLDDIDITKGPPAYDKPWVSAWGWFGTTNPTGWRDKHLKMLNQTNEHKNDIKLLFFGDSKTEGWIREGIDVWKSNYVNRGGYNYGIGGDSTRQVLWRIDNKELSGLAPKVLVFMIGGNNFGNNYNRGTDEEIVKAEHLIVDNIRKAVPKTHIIFVSQLPRGSSDNRARHINTLWEQSGDSKTTMVSDTFVHFINPYKKFTKPDGTQNLDLYIGDHIHLNKAGYEILAQSIEPLIKQFL
ncbi:unnamed protein product [Medioppia subpectinata]|uniref:ABC transporter domain-containing protein n=1 Tax=Medioppia subpectinata TaxID=1979941 RepID=A0A7R9PUN8_9ACAR|nr:unnamed protein product [Medioppia subpectinata]CAG2101733.1 unnamed protein product [Medioppia subpectinata]